MGKKQIQLFRRDFLKGLATLPFLGYFALGFKNNIANETKKDSIGYQELFGINQFEATKQKIIPPTGNSHNRLRIGLVGNGWRGESLLRSFGYVHPEIIRKQTINGRYTKTLQNLIDQEDLYTDFVGVCDTFSVHAQRGVEISRGKKPGTNKGSDKPAKIYPSYRDMIASGDIDAIVIATPDHMHASIAIEAAKAGLHVYLEKPMTHSIEEAVDLRDTIKSTGVVFQLGHENRQQMSFKIARELYQKGVLGDVSLVHTYTNRNNLFGAWIRDEAFDHKLGNRDNIDWEEFLGNAPWHDFDLQRYFSWQRYSDYGTSVTGNDFTHKYDCVNQVLNLGIPDSVVALAQQHYYKHHGDMPDVLNAVFHYPERGLALSYDGTLKNGIYRQPYILGSEASMEVDRAICLYKDRRSEKYKNIDVDTETPMYYYAPNTDIDAITSATAKSYIKSGNGPTFIDGKVIDATFLHVKEWVDAIRGHGKTSCDIDVGFEEAVTFNLANLAYKHNKPVLWDKVNEKAIIG